jgi:NADPH2:quinone reductase
MTQTGGPEVLELAEVPTPEPKPGEVLVRTHAIGVGKPDVLVRTGIYKWMPPLPTVIGLEASGHVAAVGAGVTGFRVGQPVFAYAYKTRGCYAEYVSLPAKDVTVLPESVDLDDAATLSNFVVAWALLHDVPRGPHLRTIYVNGAAGGVGSALVQLARHEGIEVIAGASSAGKCAFAASLGATHTIDYSRENVADRVLALTGGRGVDVSCDQIIGRDFPDTLRMLATFGTVMSYNALGGMPATETFTAMRANLPKSPGIRCFTLHSYDHEPGGVQRLVDATVAIFAGRPFRPAIHARMPLAEARRAHELLDARAIHGKILLVP